MKEDCQARRAANAPGVNCGYRIFGAPRQQNSGLRLRKSMVHSFPIHSPRMYASKMTTEAPFADAKTPDFALEAVAEYLLALDPAGLIWASVIRHTYDMIYNGQETGRYRWDQLMKTEKTHFGTLFEINAQRAFNFEGGDATDYRIASFQVDAKWSQSMGGWMMPPEIFGELALVATGDDLNSTWSLGLIRVRAEFRSEGQNRDKKSQLNELGRASIRWLWHDAPLRPNVLLQLPRSTVDRIFLSKFGTQRTNELFRAAEGRLVHRNIVATVSRQLDHQKRVRYNGGARSALKPEGFVILSGLFYPNLARDLGVPVPLKDEYISVRVLPSSTGGVKIGEGRWRRAGPEEAVTHPAPRLPKVGVSDD